MTAALAGCGAKGSGAAPAEAASVSLVTTAAPAASPSAREAPIASATASVLASASAAPTESSSPCPAGMALIPAGRYRMRKQRHDSAVSAFCLDVTEVTVAGYKACVRAGKCAPDCLKLGQCSAVPQRTEWGDADENARSSRFCNGDLEDRQNHPVNCVSYDEAETYCQAYEKRLPRAEEWEWAARRAEPDGVFPWGKVGPDDQLCWSPKKSRHDGTCPIKSYALDHTPQGVWDLAGNVAEWVDTDFGRKSGVHQAHGASWYSMDDGYVGGAIGGVDEPSKRNETVGFRCAAALTGPSPQANRDAGP